MHQMLNVKYGTMEVKMKQQDGQFPLSFLYCDKNKVKSIIKGVKHKVTSVALIGLTTVTRTCIGLLL